MIRFRITILTTLLTLVLVNHQDGHQISSMENPVRGFDLTSSLLPSTKDENRILCIATVNAENLQCNSITSDLQHPIKSRRTRAAASVILLQCLATVVDLGVSCCACCSVLLRYYTRALFTQCLKHLLQRILIPREGYSDMAEINTIEVILFEII